MVLMIFVNDLWSLTNIPVWLLHTTADQDGMGLSDVIFPAFLFIVGMSIPFAIGNRRARGESKAQTFRHILVRSAALLIMGLFLVNGEKLNAVETGMSRLLYNVITCTAFVLIWNAYDRGANRVVVWIVRSVGILALVTLAIVLRVGREADTFSVFWWGILGLIGWCYLVGGVAYTICGGRIPHLLVIWVALLLLSMLAMEDVISFGALSVVTEPIGNGSLPFLTLSGVVTSVVFLEVKERWSTRTMLIFFSSMAVLLFVAGVIANRFWIVAKLGATPPWVLMCSAITLMAFVVVYWIADLRNKRHWFNLIRPAGTNTLLTYLIPHYAYALVAFAGISWPAFMLTGLVGLAKSFAFALICVLAAGWLEQRKVKLKL